MTEDDKKWQERVDQVLKKEEKATQKDLVKAVALDKKALEEAAKEKEKADLEAQLAKKQDELKAVKAEMEKVKSKL